MLGSTKRLEAEAQRVAVAGDRDGVNRRRVASRFFGATLMSPRRARIEAHRRDDLLAVLQLEQPLDRLAVAGRRRHVDDAAGVGDAEVLKNTQVARVLPANAASTASPSRSLVVDRSLTSFCRFTQPSRDTMTTLSSSTMKSSAVYSGSPVSLAIDGAALVAVTCLLDLLELAAHQLPAAVFVLEQRGDLARALALLLELVADDQDFEPRQPVDLQLEDRVGLLGVELEPLHDLLGGVGLAVGLADDADDLVERVEDLLEALEDVDALLERRQLVLEPPGDDLEPEMQEVPEDLLEIEPLGTADFGVLRSGSGR